MIAVFLLVLFSINGLIHLYLYKRLVRDTLPKGRTRKIAGFVVLGMALLVIGTLVGTRVLPFGLRPWLAWPGYIWLAAMFFLLVALWVMELPRLALLPWVRARRLPVEVSEPESVLVGGGAAPPASPPAAPAPSRGPIDPSRRLLLGRSAAAIAGAFAFGATTYGVSSALGDPRLRKVTIPLAKLPASMNGFRIALVSDIHLGPLLGRAHTERIVRMINGVDADLVAIVGDLVDGSVDELGAAAEPLADLRARHGAFFVTGNHEYFSGHEQWLVELPTLGLKLLRNERVAIDGLDLAGVNDLAGEDFDDGPDFNATLDGRDPSRPVVLLAHQPVQAREAARHGVDLQLSGHTHGGQIKPFHLVVGAVNPVVSGLGNVDGTPVFVTNGAGFWGPPVRFGAPPDISIVTLER